MLGVNCQTPLSSRISPSHMSFFSSDPETELIKNVLNMSPQVSTQLNPIVHMERPSHGYKLQCWDSEVLTTDCNSRQSNSPVGTPSHKSSVELRREIVTLEAEIMHLERHLLSLYRTAYEEQMFTLPRTFETQPKCQTEPPRKNENGNEIHQESKPPEKRNSQFCHNQISFGIESYTSSFNITSTGGAMDSKTTGSGHLSLADHLSPSCLDSNLITADRLSEDIIRCISSIYCKLANPGSAQVGFTTSSPISSLSASSIFSSQNTRDSWSPCQNEENSVSREIQGLREENGAYGDILEVKKICLDDDNFKFAASTLQKFRSLVRRLEDVNLSKMKREEKLAFWINIHNALVMHAYLTYGSGNRVKTNNILKAAYIIGGHYINAYMIQNTILGIQSHHSSLWLPTLFSPLKKPQKGNVGHAYALEYPEPLVHFALCSGAHSDPLVRVYTAKTIFLDLKAAKEEFIEANVYINKETKIILPRILHYFAKDTALQMPRLMETVNECLSEVKQKAIKPLLKGGKLDKCIQWLPENPTFRYVFYGELAGGSYAV
ncbi:hypothetical protein SAY86_015524 [Trapa natans]|uniref:DUF547 domain-containing protein n=1 Tax=Trapa natans TaxID=22666 RepID=A0AAN7L7X2_TRANT|nr:hypothetical protein SAY86_015524 [Trapa natans]